MSGQLKTSETSSIGAVWPPQPTTHNRLRGFYTDGIVRSAAEAQTFAEYFRAYERDLTAENDRLSVRVVAHTGSLAMLSEMGVTIEAAIPLARPESDLVVAYAGSNSVSRTLSTEQIASHSELLTRTAANRGASKKHTLPAGWGYGRVIPGDSGALVGSFTQLYKPFGYDEAATAGLLDDPHNTIIYISTDQDAIVSTAMAERAEIAVGSLDPLTLVEITEASTLSAYQGQGLYRIASGILLQSLIQDPTIHAIYGESNLAKPGVIIAAHENGRRFSHFDAAPFGINNPGYGVLPQNFHVADDSEVRQYNDFAVSYVPPLQLQYGDTL